MKQRSKRNKKGNLSDIMYSMVTLVSLALVIIFVWMIISNFNVAWQASDVGEPSKTGLTNMTTNLSSYLDWLFIIALMSLAIGIVIVSARFNIDPKFFPVFLVLSIIILFASAMFANVYDEIATHDNIIGFSADFPKINWVFDHFVLVMLFFVTLTGIALYANPGNLTGGGL